MRPVFVRSGAGLIFWGTPEITLARRFIRAAPAIFLTAGEFSYLSRRGPTVSRDGRRSAVWQSATFWSVFQRFAASRVSIRSTTRKSCFATVRTMTTTGSNNRYVDNVARTQTVTYGSARPPAFAKAGWVASNSRTRSSVLVRTSVGEVMQ